MATKTIRIPAMIDENGKWCAYGFTDLEKPGIEPDWSVIDEAADYENGLTNPQRYWITVELPLPAPAGEVTGSAEPEAA